MNVKSDTEITSDEQRRGEISRSIARSWNASDEERPMKSCESETGEISTRPSDIRRAMQNAPINFPVPDSITASLLPDSGSTSGAKLPTLNDYTAALEAVRVEINRAISGNGPDPAVMFDVMLEIHGRLKAVGK